MVSGGSVFCQKEHAELQRHKVHWNNKLSEVHEENKRLKKVLQETQQKLLNLPRQNRVTDVMEVRWRSAQSNIQNLLLTSSIT